MTSVTKDRIISGLIGALASFFVAVAVFGMNRNAIKVDFEKAKLDAKADVVYVDKQDGEIKSSLKDFEVQQEQRHALELQQEDRKFDQVDKKLDIIIKLIEKK